ncbi:MAG: hypothetical protein K2X00_03535 [Nitrospiraceae bacterium]|nr:hypothetical protein [Nitrospiraceae bacterium]
MYLLIDIPELDELPKSFPQYWLKIMFIGTISKSFQVNSLTSTYLRLVEAAIAEYRLGHTKLKEFWDTHDTIYLSAMHRSVSHFESCLSDMHRAINCFTRLRRHRELPESLRRVLNKQKPHFIASQVSDQLRLFRNDIHHLDKLLNDGRLKPGQPISLMPDGPEVPHPSEQNQTNKTIDRLIIAQRELKFVDLAKWLAEMAVFAGKIAEYQVRRDGETAKEGTETF